MDVETSEDAGRCVGTNAEEGFQRSLDDEGRFSMVLRIWGRIPYPYEAPLRKIDVEDENLFCQCGVLREAADRSYHLNDPPLLSGHYSGWYNLTDSVRCC